MTEEDVSCVGIIGTIGCKVVTGGAGLIIIIIILGGAFAQGAWETGEIHNVQPEQVAQVTTGVASSPGSGAILAIGLGMLIVIGLLAVVFKGTASISRMAD